MVGIENLKSKANGDWQLANGKLSDVPIDQLIYNLKSYSWPSYRQLMQFCSWLEGQHLDCSPTSQIDRSMMVSKARLISHCPIKQTLVALLKIGVSRELR